MSRQPVQQAMRVQVVLPQGAAIPLNAVRSVVAPRPVDPRERLIAVLQELNYAGDEGHYVPLTTGVQAAPTEQQLRVLFDNRKLLQARGQVPQRVVAGAPNQQGQVAQKIIPGEPIPFNFMIMANSLIGVLETFDRRIDELGVAKSSPQDVYSADAQRVKDLSRSLASPFYASQVLESLLTSPAVTQPSSFASTERHVNLLIAISSKLQAILLVDAAIPEANSVQKRLASVVRTLIGSLWFLLAAVAIADPVAVLKHLKGDGQRVAACSADLYRWFNVAAGAAIQVLLSGPKEFANTATVAAEFVVNVMCGVQFASRSFFRLSPTKRGESAADEELLTCARSASIAVRTLCGSASGESRKPSFADKMGLPFGAQQQQLLRSRVASIVAANLTKAKDAPVSFLQLFCAAGVDNAELLHDFLMLAPEQQGSLLCPVYNLDTPHPAPPNFVPKVAAFAFAFAQPPTPGDRVAGVASLEEEKMVMERLWLILEEAVLHRTRIETDKLAELIPQHPMIFSHIVPILGQAASRCADVAAMLMKGLQRVASTVHNRMRTFKHQPPKPFQAAAYQCWVTGFTLVGSISKNPALNSDDAAVCLDIVSKLFPSNHLQKVLNPPQNDMEKRRSATVYNMLKGLSRTLFETAVSSPATQPRVLGTALELAEGSGFNSNFSDTQRLHVYIVAFASPEAAKKLSVKMVARYLMPVAQRSLSCTSSPAVRLGAHDAMIAPMLAKHKLAPLIVPTYVKTFAPSVTSAAPKPPIPLVSVFIRFVRAVCQSIELCEAPADLLSEDELADLAPDLAVTDIAGIRSLGASLSIVQALFESAKHYCEVQQPFKEDLERKKFYVSGLINTLQCSDPEVLSRTCAAFESIVFSSLVTRRAEQKFWVGHATKLVQRSISHSTKKDLLEWLLKLEERIDDTPVVQRSKL